MNKVIGEMMIDKLKPKFSVEILLSTQLCLPQTPRGINLILIQYNNINFLSTLNEVNFLLGKTPASVCC
jgi:hypothetical protein